MNAMNTYRSLQEKPHSDAHACIMYTSGFFKLSLYTAYACDINVVRQYRCTVHPPQSCSSYSLATNPFLKPCAMAASSIMIRLVDSCTVFRISEPIMRSLHGAHILYIHLYFLDLSVPTSVHRSPPHS